MPNQRSANQTLIAFALHRDLLTAMDAACDRADQDRSTFIRQALVAKIQSCDQPVQPEWVKAQVRVPGQPHYVSPESIVHPFSGRPAEAAAPEPPAAAPAVKKRPAAPPVKKAKAPAARAGKH